MLFNSSIKCSQGELGNGGMGGGVGETAGWAGGFNEEGCEMMGEEVEEDGKGELVNSLGGIAGTDLGDNP